MTLLDDNVDNDGADQQQDANGSQGTVVKGEESTPQQGHEAGATQATTMTTVHEEDSSSSSVTRIPQEIWDPVLEHYVQYWFGRTDLHETVHDEVNGTDVTPLIEAVLNGDEASVYLLLFIRDMREQAAAEAAKAKAKAAQFNATISTSKPPPPDERWAVNGKAKGDTDKTDHSHNVDILRESDSHGWKAIHYAVLKRNEPIVRLLLDYDMEKHARKEKDSDGRGGGTVQGNKDNNDDWIINSKKLDSETPLHIATDCGNESMVQLLLSKSFEDMINVNVGDMLLHTPLHVAVKRRQYGIAKLLLEVGNADPNATSLYRQKTPLHFVFFRDNKFTRLLVEHGCDVAAQDSEGNTWLHLMLKNHRKFYKQDDFDTIAYVIEEDRKKKSNEKTALGKHVSILNMRNNEGKIPLAVAEPYVVGEETPSQAKLMELLSG